MRIIQFAALAGLTAGITACSPSQGATVPARDITGTTGTIAAASTPFTASDLPKLAGQAATCGASREKTFTLEAREAEIDLGMGLRFNAWTYNGKLPGPALEACEGDRVTITVANHAEVSHGLDSHALRTDTMHFGPVGPGESMTMTRAVDTPGVFMYHCAAAGVTDMHIKSGLYGAMIVYPRKDLLRPARELVVVESAIFGNPDKTGLIPGTDPERARRNDPALMMFNGRLEHTPLSVSPGDLIRAYVVNVGPGTAAIHVMGTILDTVYDGASEMRNVQTYGIPTGSGAIVEFRIPESGMYGLVDHDRLAYLPYGMVLSFDAAIHANDTH